MHILILIALLFVAVLGPGLWVKRVMARYHNPPDRYAVSGGEAARKLLDSLGLEQVKTEVTEAGDHYDPMEKAVRLSEQNFHGKSLTAITIAAHEVGHALQDAEGYAPLKWRSRLVQWVGPVEKIGAGLMMATPLILGVTRLPMAGAVDGDRRVDDAGFRSRDSHVDPADRVRCQLWPGHAVVEEAGSAAPTG